MNLNNEIMNIQVKSEKIPQGKFDELPYKLGHRDARHVAAELSLKAEARIEELESSLDWALEGFKSVLEGKSVRDVDEIICYAEKLLGNNK